MVAGQSFPVLATGLGFAGPNRGALRMSFVPFDSIFAWWNHRRAATLKDRFITAALVISAIGANLIDVVLIS